MYCINTRDHLCVNAAMHNLGVIVVTRGQNGQNGQSAHTPVICLQLQYP